MLVFNSGKLVLEYVLLSTKYAAYDNYNANLYFFLITKYKMLSQICLY